jgi:uncharacterized protein (TIGR03083 family)
MSELDGAREYVRTVGAVVRREAARLAAEWRTRGEADWERPSACTGWSVRRVAAHITDGAERAELVARAAVEGAPVPTFPMAVHEERQVALLPVPGAELGQRTYASLDTVFGILEGLDNSTLHETVVPMTGGPRTLYQFASQRLVELSVHSWDIQVAFDPRATIPADVAALIVDSLIERAPRLTDPPAAAGVFHQLLWNLEGPGGGPVALAVEDGKAWAARGGGGTPDLCLTMPVEAWVRLVWRRLPLAEALDAGVIRTTDDRDRVTALEKVFPGH